MQVIVTRPQDEAQRWVRDLSGRGFDARLLPLIKVGPVDPSQGLVRAWQQLGEYVGVMFVSGNAVAHFFASKPLLVPDAYGFSAIKTRVWAPGPGTAQALLRAGVALDRLDTPALEVGQFDSEALWQVVGAQVHAGDRVLIVRGGDASNSTGTGQGAGREWFANRIAQAGARAEFVVAYQRCVPDFNAYQCQQAVEAATNGAVWLFSSSEAVANLAAWLPVQSWSDACAVATHPRIAAAVKKIGFGRVLETRPTLIDVLETLEHLRQTTV